MSQTQTVQSSDKGRRRQQGSKILHQLMNPLVKLVLNSPLHGGMSKRIMIFSFTGQKTGKRYSTPVSYVRDGDHVIVVTYSPWGNNFKEPVPVQM
jgi:hypothetical protein